MSISSLNFVFSQFETEKYRYFSITDEEGDVVLSQNDLIDADRALNKLRSFFKENEGTFTIRVYSKKLSNPNSLLAKDNSTIAKYNVEVTRPQLPQGISGITGVGMGYGQQSSLPPDDPRNNAPNVFQILGQLSAVESQMKLMEKDHEHFRQMQEMQMRLNRMEEEQNKAKGMGAIVDRLSSQLSDPAVLMGLISGVSQMFNKNQQHVTPMNGVNPVDSQIQKNIATSQQIVTDAVRSLMQVDPNFPENLRKLSLLAQQKPEIYKMAIAQLNSL